MNIEIEWHNDQFNVNLSSKEGRDAFLSIKGCRIVSGAKGDFVSYPARKQDNGKWWNHVWGSEEFNRAVLEKAQQAAPRSAPRRRQDDDNSDVPF